MRVLKDEIDRKEDPVFDTLEKARNYLKVLKAKLKRRADVTEFPVTTTSEDERATYLSYCIGLCPHKKTRAILMLRMQYGCSYEYIASYLQRNGHGMTNVNDVKKAEKEGMMRVEETIARKLDKGVPILGGT